MEAGALQALVVCVTDAHSDLALQRVAIIGVFDLVYNSGMQAERDVVWMYD